MRFVDEYRAPEQVMQLIEHLRERATSLHRQTPSADYRCVAVYPRYL